METNGIKLSVITILFIAFCSVPVNSKKNTLCYFTNWAQYRDSPAKHVPDNIDPFLCTHLFYAFGRIINNQIQPYESNDYEMWRDFNNLKQRNPELKTLLAVGGFTHGPVPFTTMSRTNSSRSQFITTTISLLRQRGFDGLDLDWEYPGDRDSQDKYYLSIVLQELREAFNKEATETGNSALLLTAAVTAGISKASVAYDVPVLDRTLDMISVMAYDYHGAWDSNTGLASPLESPPDDLLSVTNTMNWYLAQGASRAKLQVGLAVYGRSWTLTSPTNTNLGAPTITGGAQGPYTKTAGILAGYEVCTLLTQGYAAAEDPLGRVMYAYSGNQWITFETRETFNIKADYIIQEDFGGAMVWSLDHDDFPGTFCGTGPYPLINTISARMAAAPNSGSVTSTSTAITTTTAPPRTTTTPQESSSASSSSSATTTTSSGSGDKTTSGDYDPMNYKCPKPYGFYQDPSSCHHYYMCISTLAMRVQCPRNTNYDPARVKCYPISQYSCNK